VTVTHLDWIAVGIAAVAALFGLRRGLIATALSLGGLAAGAVLGARLGPHVLHNGASSPYTPVAALIGALVGAALLQWVATLAGAFVRGSLSVVPPLRLLDSIGGLVAGAALGLALVWVAGAVVLQLPGQSRLQHEAHQSEVLQQLNRIAPPRSILRALHRIDPFPAITGPEPPKSPPDNRALASASVRHARASVVRIIATACGVGVEGTGWVARPHLVVTAGHVVAGARGITVSGHRAQVLALDRRNDVAVLRAPALKAAALELVNPHTGDSVAILGFPENGPFDARAGRVGTTADVVVNGSLREVTAVSGLIRHGNSGGPAVNSAGQVESTIFAARIGASGGYGTPAAAVRRALAKAKKPVSTGKC
jgi:S1-C subfamily serine protease